MARESGCFHFIWGCPNKVLQTELLKRTGIYCLSVLENRSPKLRGSTGDRKGIEKEVPNLSPSAWEAQFPRLGGASLQFPSNGMYPVCLHIMVPLCPNFSCNKDTVILD